MYMFEAGNIFSVAPIMEFAAFKRALLTQSTAILDPFHRLLAVISMVDSINVIVHSFYSLKMYNYPMGQK